MSDFWQYNFPPFFTIQPNDETRRLQMDAWCEIILDYCKRKRLFTLNIGDSITRPPFRNEKIDRNLTEESLYTILEEMYKRGRIEWIQTSTPSSSLDRNRSSTSSSKNKKKNTTTTNVDYGKNQCLVYWLKPDEWATIIQRWVNERALQGTVCTLYEIIHSGDDRPRPSSSSSSSSLTPDQQLHNIDERILLKALQSMERSGKATLIEMDDGTFGVKFL